MDGGSEPLSGLSPSEKRERLAELLRQRGQQQLRQFPLSFTQQRLWLLNEMEGGQTIAYNIPIGLRLQGKLDVALLERAFGEVTRRHDALRTTFQLHPQSGAPVQLIHPWSPFHLEVVEVSASHPDEQESQMRRLASQESQRPFDLRTGPLIRARLLRQAADHHILVITMHHIVSDGWSVGLIIHELATLYEAYSQGQDSPLPPLPIQYVDFAHWQRAWMTSQVLEQQLGYWREQLQGPLAVLELPTRGPRPATYSTRGAVRVWRMGRDLSEGAKALSQRQGVTLFMTLMAAFKVLLYRYTQERDLLVGTPMAGRSRRELEGLIGVFINTLVLRTDMRGEPSFGELLGRVKEVALGAYANQDVPFEKLVEELQPARDMSRSPLFQVMFVLQNAPMPALKMADVIISHHDLETATSKFDMTFAVMEKEDGTLSGWLEYNTTLFDEPMIEQMIRHYQNIVRSIIANPDLPISRIHMLDAAERLHALAPASGSPAFHPNAPSLHQLFEAQAAASPQAIALVFDGASLTYSELNQRANQLAHLLRSRGLGPDRLVGLSVDRSPDMVIAILAILKAGAAYVPLDPAYPKDRLAFVLDDARISVLLTQQPLLDALPQSQAETICLDRDWQIIARQPSDNPPPCATADHLAYVIYTSGSTGKPKGALITHANIVRLFAATQAWFNFDHRDVWTLFHSFAFDFSVWELWGALLYGGRLVIVPYLVSRSPQAFDDLLVAQQVTVLNQTPSAFRQFMQVAEATAHRDSLALRLVIFGGEALDLQSLRPWFERHGDQRPQLVNMYGITETTVHVTYRPLTTDDAADGNGSMIGSAIADLYVYVLDQQFEPVAVGVAGELYVGGAGVARGYLNRPEMTAQRFIADPHAVEAGARLYRTGDLGRRWANGELEYLGRIDQQVKIRGFRIEMGEVEATLYEQPGVREAVIVAREMGGGEKEMVAYIVGDEQEPPNVNELRSGLKRKLPEYMVPAAFVMLERLPLTENGKVDRRALPAPSRHRDELEQAYVGPRTDNEQIIVNIFAEILRLDQVGINDNFFDLGGHSLLATQVLTRLTEKFNVEVSLRRLFETPTVAGLAEALVDLQQQSAVPLTPIEKISQPVEELLAHLDQLSDQQVEALLMNFSSPQRRT